MAINQYFDESKIIKKNKKENQETNISKETDIVNPNENKSITEVKEEKIENVEEKIIIDNEPLNENYQDIITHKKNEYINAIQDFQNGSNEEKPIYNFTRENGKAKINPIVASSSLKDKIVKEETINNDRDIFQEQLLKIKEENEKNLQKSRIEIILYKELIKNETDSSKKQIYSSRIEIFMKEMDLYKKRKKILEDEKLWQKD